MKALIVLLLLLMAALPVSGQASTPQPIPLPTQQMYEQMATANAQLDDLPSDLTRPDGAPILPAEDGTVLFGYIKWLVSPAAADEYAGPFAPVFQHIGVGLTILMTTAGIYALVYVIANVGAWVGWLIDQARKGLDLLLQIFQAGPAIIVVGIAVFVIYKVAEWALGEQAVQDWISQQIDNLAAFVNDIVARITGGM
jgi:hypothetical protein